MQVIKNLFFIGKCFCLIPIEGATTGADDMSKHEISMAADDTLVKTMDQLLPWLFLDF